MRETTEERRETYNVACIFCNTRLTEGKFISASMVCPGCGRHLVVRLQNGRLTIFEDRRKKNALRPAKEKRLTDKNNMALDMV